MRRDDWRPEDVAETLNRDREATDRTLRAEREHADQLAATAVAEEADAKLAAVRAESDAHASPNREPAGSISKAVETLADAAETLSDAADGLARAAHKLQETGDSAAVETLHNVTRALDEVARNSAVASSATVPAIRDSAQPVVAGQLADVAESDRRSTRRPNLGIQRTGQGQHIFVHRPYARLIGSPPSHRHPGRHTRRCPIILRPYASMA